MTMPNSYPMTITPLSAVRRARDDAGRPMLSFRARTQTAGREDDRTVRCFGPDVARFIDRLAKGQPVKARLSHDSFTGADGRRAQSLRLVSISA